MGKIDRDTIQIMQKNYEQLKQKCLNYSSDFFSPNKYFTILMELYNFIDDQNYQSKNKEAIEELVSYHFTDENGCINPLIRDELVTICMSGCMTEEDSSIHNLSS